MDSLLDLAVDHGFDRYIAVACLARLAEIFGEDGQHFLTAENCGEDFVSSLADAIDGTESSDNIDVLECEARGSSNGMVINSLSDDKGGVTARNRCPLFSKLEPFISKKVKADLSTSKTRKANSTSESICDNFSPDDSDIEMLDEMYNDSINSVSVQRKTRARELQSRSSTDSEYANILSDAEEQKLLQLTLWF
ncbi:unnamed protein product [Urochloa decumbens]|uniref:Uncharacterized protein n=1 Tax=Urochloa decumbens TaxID=240449 RepID=A0ABC9ANZ1_9POAL